MRETPSDLVATMSSFYQSKDSATLIKTYKVKEPRLNRKAVFLLWPPKCSKRIPKTWWT